MSYETYNSIAYDGITSRLLIINTRSKGICRTRTAVFHMSPLILQVRVLRVQKPCMLKYLNTKQAAVTAVYTCPGNGRVIWDEVWLVVLPLCTRLDVYK
jgi:hypothetical protein